MAPVKRKADAETDSSAKSKKNRASKESSTKRRKSETAPDAAKSSAAAAENKFTSNLAAPSLLQAEEKAFPRGGASVLTPLEHKQIRRQAEQDVLFEQSGSKGAAKPAAGSDDEAEEEVQSTNKFSGKKRKSSGKREGAADKEEPKVKIESLNFKKLVQGAMVLGQVQQINSRGLVLALPNNLTGFVPLTEISDQFLSRLEKFANDDENEEEEGDDEDAELDPRNLFHTGQFLRAVVTSPADESSKTKKRLELSIAPRAVNKSISKSNLAANSIIQAAVVSNEEHGLVMDLGLEDKDVKGFLSAKELDPVVKQDNIQEGSVFMCLITSISSDGRVVKLSAKEEKTGNTKKHYLREAPSIDAFLPGVAAEVLVTDVSSHGLVGKIMGMLDATADVFHVGTLEDKSREYSVGQKVKARVISTFPQSEPRKVGVSLLSNILSLKDSRTNPLDELPLSSFVEAAKVRDVVPGWGLVLEVGNDSAPAFVHISRISDKKVESLSEDSGPYAVGTSHRARIVGYNPVDGLFLASLQESVLNQPFLRVEDVKNGQVVKGTVESFHFTGTGQAGLRVRLAEGIVGFVPEIHLADVQLQHPERKYREGMSVTARVLSVDVERRRITLSLKKSLVNSDAEVWQDYANISVGDQAPGTITKLNSTGAEVQFFGRVKGWLHKSEMSEAFIADPTKHFKLGQTVNVRVLSIDHKENRLKLSCKDPGAISPEARASFRNLEVGSLVKGTVLEKTPDTISIELEAGVKANLKLGHLTDKSEKQELSETKRIRVGQTLDELVVLRKLEAKVAVMLSHKPSLREAAKSGNLLKSFAEVKQGRSVVGFVRAITPNHVFVEFASGLCGALFKSQMTAEMLQLPDFGLRINQSITATVSHVDSTQEQFRLSVKTRPEAEKTETRNDTPKTKTVNPVDGETEFMEDFVFGKETKARISSVKDTQLNVYLADNVQGRVDVSEAFNEWNDIHDKKHPLRKFKPNEVISVRVIGMHDARNHRFLPISHRQGRVPVFELSAKKATPKSQEDLLTLDKITKDSTWTAFVNNYNSKCIWVNVSPNVRGRIQARDLSDDISVLGDIGKFFPTGSALRVKVKNVDPSLGHLDLLPEEKIKSEAAPVTWSTISAGTIIPGRVIVATERSVALSLSSEVTGSIGLTEIADDYDEVDMSRFKKNEIIRAKVLSVDQPNKRVMLSVRPSNVLNSSIKPKDRQILSAADLRANDVVRGFVKNISDKGLFINLGPNVTGYVRVSDLSDSYIKDWKSTFELDKVVTGKILSVDPSLNHVQMTLKQSMIEKDYAPPLTFNDLKEGQIVTGKVRKVEEFGVFILVDNSNVSGLCHRSEMAEERVEDARTLYEEGDRVKAKVLKLDQEKRRINFGLKASYFKDTEEDSDDDMDGLEGGVALEDEDSEDEEDEEGVSLGDVHSIDDEESGADEPDAMDVDETEAPLTGLNGLKTSGFDWTGANMDVDAQSEASGSEAEDGGAKKKRRRKAQIQVDRTGELDVHGPRSVADFERLLLGQPHSSLLWISYMAFQLQLNEVEKAREIARRALRTIDPREEDEKLQVRIALLNLENSFGSDETLEEAFKEACQYHDERTVHDRLIGIYVQSGKTDKADSLYSSMLTNKSFRADPELWISYATFLLSTVNDAARARALLSRASQSVPKHLQRYLTSKFGALEFKSANGDHERGRTIFEGLLSAYPRKWDLWDMYVELEDKHAEEEKARAIYERMSRTKMKKARARKMFSNWIKWEKKKGNEKQVEKVKQLEKEWFEKHDEQGGEEDAMEE